MHNTRYHLIASAQIIRSRKVAVGGQQMRPESPEKEKAELRGRKLIGATLEVEREQGTQPAWRQETART